MHPVDPELVPSLSLSWSLSRTRPDDSEEANGVGAVRKVTTRRECTGEQSPAGRSKRDVAEGWTVVRLRATTRQIEEVESPEGGAVSNFVVVVKQQQQKLFL